MSGWAGSGASLAAFTGMPTFSASLAARRLDCLLVPTLIADEEITEARPELREHVQLWERAARAAGARGGLRLSPHTGSQVRQKFIGVHTISLLHAIWDKKGTIVLGADTARIPEWLKVAI